MSGGQRRVGAQVALIRTLSWHGDSACLGPWPCRPAQDLLGPAAGTCWEDQSLALRALETALAGSLRSQLDAGGFPWVGSPQQFSASSDLSSPPAITSCYSGATQPVPREAALLSPSPTSTSSSASSPLVRTLKYSKSDVNGALQSPGNAFLLVKHYGRKRALGARPVLGLVLGRRRGRPGDPSCTPSPENPGRCLGWGGCRTPGCPAGARGCGRGALCWLGDAFTGG